jgi:hypothetical protein
MPFLFRDSPETFFINLLQKFKDLHKKRSLAQQQGR